MHRAKTKLEIRADLEIGVHTGFVRGAAVVVVMVG